MIDTPDEVTAPVTPAITPDAEAPSFDAGRGMRFGAGAVVILPERDGQKLDIRDSVGRLAEAVGLDLLIHPMRQRAGIQRGEQMVVLIVARIIADQPVQLLAVGVGGQAVARAGDAGKGCG